MHVLVQQASCMLEVLHNTSPLCDHVLVLMVLTDSAFTTELTLDWQEGKVMACRICRRWKGSDTRFTVS